MNKISMTSGTTIADWLQKATRQLKEADIDSARLDAEIILAHTIKKPRTYLHAHGDEAIELRDLEIANARLDLRLEFTPVAYIIGHKEFYGRRFRVTTATLIPRPETETMIDMVKESLGTNLSLLPQTTRLVDVGTGTGCVGITLKLEIPELEVTLSDLSNHALTIAKFNARALRADVAFHRGDLLRDYRLPVDIICANLPYVDRSWEVSRETHAEPDMALYASNDGLALIHTLILQGTQLLPSGGKLFLEADPRQHADMAAFAKQNEYTHTETRGYIMALTKN